MTNTTLTEAEQKVLAQALTDYSDGIENAVDGGADIDLDAVEKIVQSLERKLLSMTA